MANDLYVDRNVADRMQHLSKTEAATLLDTLESLRIDPLSNSEPVPQATDLRTAEAGARRIIFTYRPADHIVMVTDLDDIPSVKLAFSPEALLA